jgi:predicted DNA-binding protein
MKRRRDTDRRNTTIRLPSDHIIRLDRLAARTDHTSRADLIRIAVDHLLPEMEKDLARFLVEPKRSVG